MRHGIRIGFGIAGIEGGRLTGGVEMRKVAEARHAEHGDPRLTLFGGEHGDAARQSDGVVPQRYGRDAEQVRQQHAFHAEVAEQEKVPRVRTDGGVEVVAALVAMGSKQAVKVFRDAPVDRVDAGSFIGGSVHPALRVIIHGLARPGGRKKVPAVPAGVNQRIGPVACVKLAQPGQDLGGFPDGFERERSGVARSAERGDIVGGVWNFCQAMADKLSGVFDNRTYEVDYVTTMEDAYNGASAMIAGHPEIKSWLVMVASEQGALGVASAIENAGLADTSCVVTLGCDETTGHWEEGNYAVIRSAAYFSGKVVGKEAIVAVVEYLVNGTEIPKEYATPAVMVDPTNYKDHVL